jgi:serine protease AprX
MKYLLLCVVVLVQLACSEQRYWVFFKDKPGSSIVKSLESWESRSLERRSKVLEGSHLLDYRDLPVEQSYIDQLGNFDITIKNHTRWFNGVSVVATADALARIAQLPFVSLIKPVAHSNRKSEMIYVDDYDYGVALIQDYFHGIPTLHRNGITGDNVLVCITDTGFNIDHIAFGHGRILGKYDFIERDTIVGDDATGTNSHGTFCLGALAGFYDGLFCGAAPGVSLLLARTEDIFSETPVEEDNWVAAMEWADSLGADIISVSLGYHDWYSYDMLNGDSAVITAAADRGVYLGMTIVIAAGNSGGAGAGTITAPGDADSAITVGAAQGDSTIAGFSSRGPTYDGRIKPDICGIGVNVMGADGTMDSLFRPASGTSAATPMIAGICALLLQLKPNLTPMQVRETLSKTATDNTSPNNDYGWGIVDARAAAAYPIDDTSYIFLDTGWNMISLPVNIRLPVSSLPVIPPVYCFTGSFYTMVDSIVPGKGYFVISMKDTILAFAGEPLTTLEYSIHRGWNLLGGLSERVHNGEFVDSTNVFYMWDSHFKTYYPTKSAIGGYGFWLSSNVDTVITLTD